MKKLLMMICMMLFSTAMFAQQGAMYLGGNLNYGLHSDYKNFGFGVKAQYEFIQNFRAEASANYFLEKDNLKMWDINANVHYLFNVADKPCVALAFKLDDLLSIRWVAYVCWQPIWMLRDVVPIPILV